MRLGITHARFVSAEFARSSLIHSLRNTRKRGNRQITEALSVFIIIIIIIITNMPVASLRCLLLVASTTATSVFTKQYSCRALLCLSRFALRHATFAGRVARRSVEAAAASYTVHAPSPFTFTDILITCVLYFALYCTLYSTCELAQRFAELIRREERFELVNHESGDGTALRTASA